MQVVCQHLKLNSTCVHVQNTLVTTLQVCEHISKCRNSIMPQNCMSTTSTIQRKNDNCRNSVGEAPWAGRQQISGTHIYTKDWSLVNVSKQAFPTHIHTQGQLPVLNEVEMLLCLQGGRKTPTVLAKLYSGKPETQISKPEPQNCDTAVF